MCNVRGQIISRRIPRMICCVVPGNKAPGRARDRDDSPLVRNCASLVHTLPQVKRVKASDRIGARYGN